MMHKTDAGTSSRHQQLLRDLKSTVEGLLVSQVANVWYIYGGLNRLHSDVDKIFRNGCKVSSDGNNCDYWKFIQGLEWLHPNPSTSTLTLDSEYKPHIPSHLKKNKGSIWLYRSLENHSLSQKLSWLLSDKTHLLSCYQSQAYLAQERYAEATLICLRAIERNQPSLISEIDPSLFLNKSNVKNFHKVHRRCSSFPDNHWRNLQEFPGCSRSKTFQTMKNLVAECDEDVLEKIGRRKVIQGKLKAWKSTPDLMEKEGKFRGRSKSYAQSRTSPCTPVNCPKISCCDLVDSGRKETKPERVEKTKTHVIIDNCNIIEHTPPIKCSRSKVEFAPPLVSGNNPFNLGASSMSAPEFSFLDVLSGVAGQKDYKKLPKKSFIEDGGMSVLPMATGYFPRPTKGQTLTSFLTSSQFTRANAELDRENAHFSISEAMIAAMEQIRCRRDLKLAEEQAEESDEEIMDLKQRIRMRRRQKLEEKQKRILNLGAASGSTRKMSSLEANVSRISSSTGTISDSLSSEEVEDLEIDEACNLTDNRGLSMSMASLYSEADLMKRTRGAPDGASDVLSAEGVALSLISRFNEKHLPRASELEWLVSEEDAPQTLLPMPKSWPINPDDSDEMPLTPLRGTSEWAPPRPQIIFTLHPQPVKKEALLKQNYRCAGCGCRVEKRYASTFRYCNYLGRYFCTQCHTNQLALIPARVLQKWDFSRYPVSNFSYRLLDQMYTDPLFRVFELNKNIGKRSKALENCAKYRLGLFFMKDFIKTCRFAETIQECLSNQPSYIYCDPEVYSIRDLVNVRSGEMKSQLKYLVEVCCRHTAECKLCLARGFVCEICNDKTVIFPWQFRFVNRCSTCGSCFHRACWNPSKSGCVRCERIDKRREHSGEPSSK